MSAPGPPIGWNVDGPSSSDPSKSKKKSKEKKKRKEKRKSKSSSSSDDSSSSSSSSSDERHKKGNKYTKLRDGKVKVKKHKKDKKHRKSKDAAADFGVPIHLMQGRVGAPETQESWQARQNIIRRVVDPSTGRERLIRGDGEILEEIVSRDRHRDINRQATAGDGQYFQSNTVGWNMPK